MGIIRRILIAVASIAAAIYAADYLRISLTSSPFGSIEINPYYAIHLKGKKIEYDFNVPTETEQCVQSLFPHFGDRPCWYASRHKREMIEE